jgi:hypothetical protein
MAEAIYELEPDDDGGEQQERSRPTFRCRTCGSQLSVTPRNGICPECDCPVAGPQALGKMAADDDAGRPRVEYDKYGRSLGQPQTCDGCGYDLRGHHEGAKCPECGLPRRGRSKTEPIDPLYLMPRDVIVSFRNGTIAVMLCLAFGAIATAALLFYEAGGTAIAIVHVAFSLAWVVGVWQVTPAFHFRQAVRRGFSDQSNLRRAARWMQFAWPAAAACVVVLTVYSGSPQLPVGALVTALLSFVLLGLAGLIVVSLLFEELADWTCDEFAIKLFRGAQWGIAVGALIVVLTLLADRVIPAHLLTVALYMAVWPALFLLAGSLIAYVLALFSLTKSVTLSLYHQKERQERERRRIEWLREQEEREERLRRNATA